MTTTLDTQLTFNEQYQKAIKEHPAYSLLEIGIKTE